MAHPGSNEPITAEALIAAIVASANAPQRITYTKAEAAGSLGVSVDFFEQHIQPHLRLVREGRKVLVPVAELNRWVTERAALTLESRS